MFLASSFKRCHKSDPHFDDCLVVNIEGAIRSLKNGKFLNFFILHLSVVFYLGHPRGMKKYDQNIIITFKFFFFIHLIIFVNLLMSQKYFQNFFTSLFLVLRLFSNFFETFFSIFCYEKIKYWLLKKFFWKILKTEVFPNVFWLKTIIWKFTISKSTKKLLFKDFWFF